ncbi:MULTISPECIES: hypothetical protein [Pseudomonas]|jgi:hypothetical protein|uniref:Uncharacterized protein n=2 Tax=Pseudomonas TaxID=286 RepID=A0AAJ5V1Q3_9PSED|nr:MULTISPECIES: hypothetical protein [Pseudomonas]MCT8164093.1 hypothetical protein [Pseudomonas sp. HD6422]MCT8182919.1 hypothetical protein [Pseudomonas sp. HD6421]MDH1930390.1 hypothetical protein [Pseudomonas sp. GD03696]MDM1711813.1 hypothetical protein [Pseudomonas sp. 165]ORL53112.1 hypothetical protein B7H18_03780 [Pseudomonas putida]
MNRQPGNVEIPRGLADRILSSLKPVTQRKRAIQACAGLKDLLAQSGAGTGSVSIGWDEAGQLLRHLAFTTGVHDPVRGLRDELDLIINNLSSRDSKVAPHQEDDCSAAGVDLAEQLSTVRRHYNRLLRDMQAIADQRLPAGMTASGFAAAAIAGALSPQVVHPRSGE